MVATTNSQLIRYPQTTDAPCDGDLHYRQMAEDIEAKLNSHYTDLLRAETPPAAIWSVSEPFEMPHSNQVLIGFPIPFDVLESQVGGTFVDLTANPTAFSFPRTGIYQVGFEATIAFDSDTTAYHMFRLVQNNPFTDVYVRIGVQQHNFDDMSVAQPDDPFFGEHITVSGLVRITDTSLSFSWFYYDGAGAFFLDQIFINSARAYAFWVAD